MSGFKEFLTKKIRNRYRLIIRNDQSLEERISVVLTPLNVILISSGLMVIFSAMLIFILPKTPLRALLPGLQSVNARDVHTLQKKISDMEREMNALEKQNNDLLKILKGAQESGYFPDEQMRPNSYAQFASLTNVDPLKQSAKADLQNKQAKFIAKRQVSDIFFTPLKGLVSDTFSRRTGHMAVDIVSYANAAVKATLSGTVVLSSWTSETGHVLIIQHAGNLISAYKHNSVLFKKQGDHVVAGEVIAIVGNSGELTTGPHLHFELWQNGRAVNPLDYVKF